VTSSPLRGLRVVVTRPHAQASALVDLLEGAGAVAVLVPVIEIVDPPDGGVGLADAVRSLGRGDWLVVTSPNGAERAAMAAGDGGLAAGVQVAAIGPGTGARAEAFGLSVTLVPERSIAEGLLEIFPQPPPEGGRVLLARASDARQVLPEGLRSMGWPVDDVAAYQTIAVPVDESGAMACKGADVVAFTSSSTVSHLIAAVGVDRLPGAIASIVPATSQTIVTHGLDIAVEAEVHTIAGLVDAMVAEFGP